MTAQRLPRNASDYPVHPQLAATSSGFFANPAWHDWVAAIVVGGIVVVIIVLKLVVAIKHHLPFDHTPPLTRHQRRALAHQTFGQRIKSRLKKLVPPPLRSRLFPTSATAATPVLPNGHGQVGQGDIRSNDSFLPAYSGPPSYTTEPPPVRFWTSIHIRRLFTNPLRRAPRPHTNANMNSNSDLERQTTELIYARPESILVSSPIHQPTQPLTSSQITQPEIAHHTNANPFSRTTVRRSSVTWAATTPSAPPEPPPSYSSPNLSHLNHSNHSNNANHPNSQVEEMELAATSSVAGSVGPPISSSQQDIISSDQPTQTPLPAVTSDR